MRVQILGGLYSSKTARFKRWPGAQAVDAVCGGFVCAGPEARGRPSRAVIRPRWTRCRSHTNVQKTIDGCNSQPVVLCSCASSGHSCGTPAEPLALLLGSGRSPFSFFTQFAPIWRPKDAGDCISFYLCVRAQCNSLRPWGCWTWVNCLRCAAGRRNPPGLRRVGRRLQVTVFKSLVAKVLHQIALGVDFR
jgi:hypothetical protein